MKDLSLEMGSVFLMSNEDKFVTEKYVFWFYEGKGRPFVSLIIHVNVGTVERRKFEEEDLQEIQGFFNDMGKWEIFVDLGRRLLEDLGINSEDKGERATLSGSERYEFKYDVKGDRIHVEIELRPDERKRRSAQKKDDISIAEIIEQVKNVPKWQALTRTISELKAKF